MKKEKGKTPRLRFPGFSDDWEQRKIKDVSSIIGGNAWKSSEYTADGDYLVITIANVTGNVFINDCVGNRLSCENPNGYLLNEGDILVSLTGNVGRVSKMTKIQGVLNQRVGKITPCKDAISPEFLFHVLRNPRFEKAMVDAGQGAAQKNISNSDVLEYPILLPSQYTEQKMIGGLFDSIDNLITLHQRKLEQMREYKKGMLQKMFPKKGEMVPEVRFPWFSENWETCKLGDIYTERNERGNDSLQILSVSIHSGVSDGQLNAPELGKNVKRSEDKSTYKHVYPGDLVFNMMRAWQGAIGVVKNEGMISPAYISAIPNNKVYSVFMDTLLRRKDVINQINNLSYGVTDFRKRLYWNSFAQVTCQIPSVEEQRHIAGFLQNIDNLIRLQQNKIDHIKEMKVGMLQQMFV